jgi:hypothetical protein
MLVSFCFLATSCTTTRPIQFPTAQTPDARPEVEAGNRVRVTLNSGEIRQFKVTVVEADALAGKDIRVPYKDMRFLEVKKPSTWRSVGLGLGIVAAVAGALLIVFIATFEDE